MSGFTMRASAATELAHRYPAHAPEIAFQGAIDLEVTEAGIRPRRLAPAGRMELPDAFMTTMVDTAAGVRIRFQTAATTIALRLVVHPIEFVGSAGAYPAAVDLEIDGTVAASHPVHGGSVLLDIARGREVVESEPDEVFFDGLDAREKHVVIWLPQTAMVEVVEVAADRPLRPAAPTRRPRWVHHGSSISHCLEARRPTSTWPAVAARELEFDLTNLSYAGCALLDPFVARTIRDQPADLISLKIGINVVNGDTMRMRAFVPAMHGFLDTIREGHPTTPIVLISPILCPLVEDLPGPTGFDPETDRFVTFAVEPHHPDAVTLTRIRTALEALVELRSATDPQLRYLDGRVLFDELDVAAGRLPDGLHPDDAGYATMGRRFARSLPFDRRTIGL